jgi:hypothetical protein
MANQRNLKAFVRYDGSGRVVAGSLILRKQKPKVGNWQEIQGYACCNGATLTTTVTTTITNFQVKIFCGGTLTETLISGQNSSSVADLVSKLNATYSLLGVFSTTGGTNLTLVMTGAQVQAICPNSAPTFTVTAVPPVTTTTTTTRASTTTTTTTRPVTTTTTTTTVAPTTTTTTTRAATTTTTTTRAATTTTTTTAL